MRIVNIAVALLGAFLVWLCLQGTVVSLAACRRDLTVAGQILDIFCVVMALIAFLTIVVAPSRREILRRFAKNIWVPALLVFGAAAITLTRGAHELCTHAGYRPPFREGAVGAVGDLLTPPVLLALGAALLIAAAVAAGLARRRR